jgi:hypothetical protein
VAGPAVGQAPHLATRVIAPPLLASNPDPLLSRFEYTIEYRSAKETSKIDRVSVAIRLFACQKQDTLFIPFNTFGIIHAPSILALAIATVYKGFTYRR